MKLSPTATSRVAWYGSAFLRDVVAKDRVVAGATSLDEGDARIHRRFALWPASLYKEDVMVIDPTGRLTPRRQDGMDNSRCGNVRLQLYADEVWSIGSKFDSFSLADNCDRDVGRLIPRVQNIFIFDTDIAIEAPPQL